MSVKLVLAMVIITLALVFYSIGVFSEFRARHVEIKHIRCFVAGLTCDVLGTLTMMSMGSSGAHVLAASARQLMTVTGSIAVALMAIHLCLLVFIYRTKRLERNFHWVSLGIWLFWLVSYAAGPIGLMMN